MGSLLSLNRLDLSYNLLARLPAGCGNLRELLSLNVEANRLHHLPDSLSGCVSLQSLVASRNPGIRRLPSCVTAMPRLERLYLDQCSLEGLPSSLARVNGLRELSVARNCITAVPRALASAPLEILRLDWNDVAWLPDECAAASPRGDAAIDLTPRPPSFHHFTHLRILSISGNPLLQPPLHVASRGADACRTWLRDHARQREAQEARRACLSPPAPAASNSPPRP